jgi:hypothetical protein
MKYIIRKVILNPYFIFKVLSFIAGTVLGMSIFSESVTFNENDGNNIDKDSSEDKGKNNDKSSSSNSVAEEEKKDTSSTSNVSEETPVIQRVTQREGRGTAGGYISERFLDLQQLMMEQETM